MSDKNRERKNNREKYEKKKREKRHKEQLKQAQAISREKRNEVRNGIKPYFYNFRTYKNKHILLVLGETENTETVLLQKFKMKSTKKGMLLALPVLTEEMIDEFLSNVSTEESEKTGIVGDDNDRVLKDFIKYNFAVEPDEITITKNVIFAENCKMLESKENLIKATVQPYKGKRWFEGDIATIHGYRIYKGNRLRKFIKTSLQDLDDVYMYQDTVTEFAMYKSLKKKIDIEDYHGKFLTYARRGPSDLFGRGIKFDPDKYNPENVVKIETSLQDSGDDER